MPKRKRPQLDDYERLLHDILAVVLTAETPLSRHEIATRVDRKRYELISRIINTLARYKIVEEVEYGKIRKVSPTPLCLWLYLHLQPKINPEERVALLECMRRLKLEERESRAAPWAPPSQLKLKEIVHVFNHIRQLNPGIKGRLYSIAWNRLTRAAHRAFRLPFWSDKPDRISIKYITNH